MGEGGREVMAGGTLLPAEVPWEGRRLCLEGCPNFRDLGGWTGHGGAPVRRRRIYRSGRLDALTPRDQAAVAALGLDHVLDFRQEAEQRREPSRWGTPAPGRVSSLAIVPGSAEAFFAGAAEADLDRTVGFMEFIYRDLALNQTEAYGALFQVLLGPGEPTVLFHCAAGKDRTGFAAALVLSALGVGWAHVLEDYLLTGAYLRVEAEMAHVLSIVPELVRPPMTRETIRPMFEVRPSYLAAAFEALEADSGSLEAYLDRRLGVDGRALAALRERYLEG